MLSPNKYITQLIILATLVLPTSAEAGLYGFSHTKETAHAEHLDVPPRHISNYRREMRNLLIALSRYGKSRNPNFQILAHEGQYLLDKSLWEYHLDSYNQIRRSPVAVDDVSFLAKETPDSEDEKTKNIFRYTDAVDGIVVNNHYCQNLPLHNLIKVLQLPVISIEQCENDKSIDNAITQSFSDKYPIYPFIDTEEAFRNIYHQLIINETADNIHNISQARNISFLIEDDLFDSRYQMLQDIRRSNYDIIVIRPVFHNQKAFTKEEVDAMKFKQNGARRLILALYNLSELSKDDYLWKKNWDKNRPNWLTAKSSVNPNAYITKYWLPEWKKIAAHYFKSIVDTEYDGVFLTGLENHNYFERNKPLE